MSYVPRRMDYAYTLGSKTIYAYTREEWGIGAGSVGGDHNTVRSFYFSLVMSILFVPATLLCLLFAVLTVFELPLMALVMLVFAALSASSSSRGSSTSIKNRAEGRPVSSKASPNRG